MALGLLCVRCTLKEVRVSDTNLVLRLLREQRDDMREFRAEFRVFRDQTNARFDAIEVRLTNLEHTVNGMAGHLFALTDFVKNLDRGVRKLETRPAK